MRSIRLKRTRVANDMVCGDQPEMNGDNVDVPIHVDETRTEAANTEIAAEGNVQVVKICGCWVVGGLGDCV